MSRKFSAVLAVVAVAVALTGARGIADSPGLNVELVSGLKCPTAQGLSDCSITRGTHLEFMTRVVGGAPHVFALEGSRDATTAGWDSPGGGLNIIDVSNPDVPTFVTNVPCKTDNLDIATVTFDDPATQPVVKGVHYDTIFALASNNTGTGCTVTNRDGTKTKGNSVQFAGIRAGASLVPGTQEVDFLGGASSSTNPVYPMDVDGKVSLVWKSRFAHTVVKHPTLPIIYADNQALAEPTGTGTR